MGNLRVKSVLSRLATCVGLSIGLLLLTEQSALAHNAIDSSSPLDGAVISAPLNEWAITFTNDVPLDSATAEIINPQGVRTPLVNPTHGESAKVVRFSLPDDLVGQVSGRWRLVSTDGHVVSGRIQFTINDSVIPGSPDTSVAPGNIAENESVPPTILGESTRLNIAPEPIRWALRFAGYGAIVLFGGLLFAQFNFAQGIFSSDKPLLLARVSAIALAVVPALQGLIFVSDVNDSSVFAAIFSIGDALSSTPGSMFLLRAVSGGVFIYLIAQRFVHAFSKDFTKLASVNALVYLTTLAYTGHARSFGAPWLGIGVDIIHTAASAIWLGGLIVMIFLVAPTIGSEKLLEAFVKFGHIAKFAVIAIVVTGVIQTFRLHSRVTTIFTSSHGQILILKVIAISLMLKVGDINRRRLVRYAHTNGVSVERKRALIVRASYTEAGIGAVVVAVTAALVTASFN